MNFSTDIIVGLDIGTTSSKAIARSQLHRRAPYVEQCTPWRTHSDGLTDIDPRSLVDLAAELIGLVVQAAESAWGSVRVRSIGITGLAESGVLLDAARQPAAPVIAWFDRRGGSEIKQIARSEPGFVTRFERTTGLPWSSQASIAKLLWLRASGQQIGPASMWLSVPEWIVFALGGDAIREPSLASRTGLIDQGTGKLWAAAVAAAGLPDRILPDERPAGFCAGRLQHDSVVSQAAGAALTVAGHDHPVAAVGVGAVGADELFNSSGTADVLARSIPGTLDEMQRQQVVNAGWSLGRHVLPGMSLLLAGVHGGLLLRRVLVALGSESAEARAILDHASLSVSDLPSGLSVAGDGRTDDDVVIRLRDGATPASVWAAAVRYTTAQTGLLLHDLEEVISPHRRAVAAGGWTRMASVRAAKTAVISAISFSPIVQPGVTGAALMAAFALTDQDLPLGDFIRKSALATSPL